MPEKGRALGSSLFFSAYDSGYHKTQALPFSYTDFSRLGESTFMCNDVNRRAEA
jgi:hypothetical protein